jgi:putative chitinase
VFPISFTCCKKEVGIPGFYSGFLMPIKAPIDYLHLKRCKTIIETSSCFVHTRARDKADDEILKMLLPSNERIASFLAQTGDESHHFNVLEEHLSYSAARLMKVWPKRFPACTIAQKYERNPEKLGNFAYANGIGNGPESSGDGYRFRGRGMIRLTGRSNYASASKALGEDLLDHPERLAEPALATMSAAWFWASHSLNELDDDRTGDNDLDDFTTITRILSMEVA